MNKKLISLGEIMHNRAFYRALHSILHPISIGAIVVLLLNDHFLKQHYPSWWTGKLSDFAGLIFAPLILATFLAWIIPPRLKNQENWVGIIAFSVTGIMFALTKTLPQVNDATSEFWEFFAGGPVKMWLDSTDLLALPALIIGWLIWNNRTNNFDGYLAPASGMMILACLSALASTPGGADYGIVCVTFDEDTLIGWSGHSDSDGHLGTNGKVYTVDSSLTSSERSINNAQECNQWLANVQQSPVWELTNPNEPNQIYRFTFGQSIEVSENAGRDWLTAIDLENIATEKRMRAKDRTNIWTGFIAEPGPLDAVFDPSGNKLYVAMGLDGILVIQSDKKPIWVSIGDYQFDEPDEIDIRFFELWPHLGMGMLTPIVKTTKRQDLARQDLR
ncbi:MAG: hypothetical protein F9K46_01415 [Anaerolineae bacterium]|nr:MAG: hypothetical protein F9K46_01415 [Anaerolineae bacterium]